MSIIFSFSLAVSITLLIAWGAFRFFCSQADRVSINRLTIIAIYLTSLLLPPDSPASFRFGFGSFSPHLLDHSY